MNIDTGEVKPWDALTAEEKASGKWVPLAKGQAWWKARQAEIAAKKAERESKRIAKQLAAKNGRGREVRAEAKRARKAAKRLALHGSGDAA